MEVRSLLVIAGGVVAALIASKSYERGLGGRNTDAASRPVPLSGRLTADPEGRGELGPTGTEATQPPHFGVDCCRSGLPSGNEVEQPRRVKVRLLPSRSPGAERRNRDSVGKALWLTDGER